MESGPQYSDKSWLVRLSERFYWPLSAEARPGAPFHWVPPASLHLQPDAPRHRETSRLSAEGRPDVHLHRGPEVWLRGLSDQHHRVHHISVAHKETTTKGRRTSSSSNIQNSECKRFHYSLGGGWFFGAQVCGCGRRIPLYPTMSLDHDTELCNHKVLFNFGWNESRRCPCACWLTAKTHCGNTLRDSRVPEWDVMKLRVKLRWFLQL